MRRLDVQKVGRVNSLWQWTRFKNPITVAFNFMIIQLCKYMPSLRVKNALLSFLGVKLGEHVAFGLAVQLDIFFPELIEIRDNTIIGYNATLLAHEFMNRELRTGRIIIGKNVVIGANSTVLAGVEIGDGAVVGAMSLVTKDVPRNVVVGGIPAKVIRKNSGK
jgi:acetyltransferase-like isoleucine patch superfamily enzyme